MGAGVKPELQDEEDPLTAYREQRDAVDPLTAYRQSKAGGSIVLPPGDTTPDVAEPPKPMRLRPVVVTKREELPKPPAPAASDATRVGPEPVGLAGHLQSHAPGQSGNFANDVAESAMEMVTHPVETAKALAETPFKGGQALGEYVAGRGSKKAAIAGTAQTAAMLLGRPAEKLAEPAVARLVGEAAAPAVTRTALGAATGAVFTPDRPAIGATLGGLAGAVSSRGVAAAKLAERQAKLDAFAKEHPEWFGESTPADVETRQSRLLANPNPATATARVVEQPPSAPAEPDFTVDEPNAAPSPIEVKGVFGGALEQHGKDYAAGKVPAGDMSTKPAENVNSNVNFAPLPSELPATVEATDAAIEQNATRYNASTDPAERRAILKLHDILAEHRAALAPPEKEETKHEYASTQLDLPEETASAIKQLGESIPDEHLAEDGREDKPHVTVKYGLHGDDPEAVRSLLADEPPITVKLGKTSFFPNGESDAGDVLKVDVESPALRRLNKKIADALPHTDTHPTYKPHATVAYLKAGLGKKYSGNESLVGHTVTLDRVTFSDKNGNKTEIPLGGKPPKAKNGKGPFTVEAYRGTGRVARPTENGFGRFYSPNKEVAAEYGAPKRETLKFDKPLRAENWMEAKKDLTLESSATMDDVLKAAAKSGFDGIVFANHNGAPEYVDLKEPPAPVHESARLPSGGLRDNLETVKTDGLIREMFKLLGAEDQRDAQRAIYRTVEADVSGTQFGVMVQAATRHGNGPSEQAKALHRIELKKGVAGRIERVLNDRGLSDPEITRRYAELLDIEAERSAELEGMDNEDSGDTSFDFPKEGYTNEHGEGAGRAAAAEGTHAPAERSASRSAGDVGPGEGEGTPPAEDGEASDVAFQRPARGNPPERNGYDQSVHDLWEEAGTNGRLALLEQWRRIFPEQDFFPEFADRQADDLPRHVRDKIGMERVYQAIALKDIMSRHAPEGAGESPKESVRKLMAAIQDGYSITGSTAVFDTSSRASRAILSRLADRPYAKQMATHFENVFDRIARAIGKRYDLPPIEFGGFDVSQDAIGMNIRRSGFPSYAKGLGLPEYRGPTSNVLLLNPYLSLMEIGFNLRLRPSEYAAALSEATYGTMVHEIAHQHARGHDEQFSGYHTRYAGAAAPIAHHALIELDAAWEIALQNGIADDLITLQHEVWDAEQQRRDIEGRSNLRPGSTQGNPAGVSVGGDATAAHLRPLEGNSGVGEGDAERKRLGGRDRGSVRGSAARSETAGDAGSRTPGPVPRNGRKPESAVDGSEPDTTAVATAAAGRFDKVVDDVKKMFAPASRGPLARETANITREQVARMAHENEIARDRLAGFAKAFDKMSREDRLEFIDAMENPRPQATEQLSDAADAIRDMLDSARDAVRRLGTGHLENFIENYFPHIWSNPDEAARVINQITGKRPLEGTRSFLKRRTIPTIKEGMELGLEPISTNPVDLSLLKIREMNRYIMGQRVLGEMKRAQLAKFISAFEKAPDGYARINDHVAMVYGPPTVPVGEAFDALVRKQLVDVIKSLGVEHTRPIKIKGLRSAGGGTVWGVAEGDRRIQAKFGGDATIIMHELGHIIDHRYGLWDKLVERVAKRPNTKAKLEKNRGKLVPDQKHPSNSEAAKKRRVTIKKELRALADLRYEGENPDNVATTYKDYVRERPEQVANAVHAYIYAKAKMQRVAPTVYDVLDGIIKGDPKLAPLANVEPSVKLGSGSNETPVGGLVVKGQYWAPEAAARIINNYLSPGLRGNAVFDSYMGLGNFMNGAQLGFSAFHLGFTSMEAAVSRTALALRQLAAGKPVKALSSLATAPAAPITNYMRGRNLYNAYMHPDRSNAEMTQIVDALISGGGRIRMDNFYKSGAIEGLKKALEEHNPWGVLWRAYPAFIELAVKPILEHVVPRQKMGVFSDLARLEIEKLGQNPDPADVRAAMAKIWDSVDNRMGQLVYDNLFWNKVGKDLAMASVRAVGWNLGTLREIGGGLAEIPGSYKRWKEGDEVLTTKLSYILALPIFVGMMGAIYNYLATGESPKELKDYFYPRTGALGPDGNPERVQLPSYMKDVWAYAHHPVNTIESKLHPTIEQISEMLHNKDFYGTMIVDPDAPLPEKLKEYGKFLSRSIQPFALRNALVARERGQSLATQAQSFVGVTAAPREVVRTEAQNKMSEFLSRHAPSSRTPEDSDKGELHRTVTDAVRKGEQLPQSVNDALERGKLKRGTLMEWIHDARLPTTVQQFKKLSLDEAERVYGLATDDEKALWANAYRTKVVNGQR